MLTRPFRAILPQTAFMAFLSHFSNLLYFYAPSTGMAVIGIFNIESKNGEYKRI